MKHLVSALCLLACWPAALLAETAAPSVESGVWRAGIELSAVPYTFRNAQGEPDGFSTKLLKAVAEQQGLQLDYVLLDWPELLAEFKAGRIDIIANIADTAERRSFIDYSTTTVVMRGRLFLRNDRPKITSREALRGLRIATILGSRADEYVRKENLGLQTVYQPSFEACVCAVYEGRADVMLATELITVQYTQENNLDEIVAAELEFPDFVYEMRFGVAEGKTALLGKINDGLVAMHRNGTYDTLYEKWLGHLAPRPLRWRELQPYLLPLGALIVIALSGLLWQRALLRRVSAQARAIRENEQRLHLVFEGSQDGFWDWEVAAGRILRSPRWASMLGYTLEEIGPARQSFLNLVHPDDRRMLAEDFQRLLSGHDHFNIEFRMRAKSGEWKWILDRGKVVSRDPETGAPLRITGTHTDITPRKLAEEQADRLEHKMQETQKLESLGVLAGGVAHDFNNLLTVILGNSTLARMESGDAPVNRERLDAVVAAAQRAAELCHQLLAYAGRASYTVERLQLNDIVKETARFAEMSIGKHASLYLSLADELPLIEGDSAQLRQVIMNLVTNAAEAIYPRQGTIQISTELTVMPVNTVAGSPRATTPATAVPAVCLRVTDDGSGMSPEVVTRVFDPFFSTKFTGRGLGLAAVQGIVRALRGSVTVESTHGKGSTFRVYLPALSSAASREPFAQLAGTQTS